MTATAHYLAFDLGASSGRAMLGVFDGARLTLEEVHRFANGPVRIHGHLYWDALRLFDELKAGIAACTQRGVHLDAIGIDTWGVDFGLLARGGELLAMPRHYRDPRNQGVMERVFQTVPRAEIYQRTGIQFLPFNSLYQLVALQSAAPTMLDAAERLLFMPDLFAYWLTGTLGTERTIASTSQMLDPRAGAWDVELLRCLGLPAHILPAIAATATPAGPLLADVSDEVGQAGTPVIRCAGHDTAAAVAAVPAQGDDWAYISSGTWSLVGVELPAPRITPETRGADFTNEAGVAGTTRFLRNVTGLWLVQECQRAWDAAGQDYSWEELARLAEGAPPFVAFVDPDDPRFAEPGDMPARIRAACSETGQPVPDGPGPMVRCALESLALKCRHVLDTLERITGRRIGVLHIVGGGVRNALLNQFIADATGKPVRAGPAEATAAGNVMVQALAQGRVSSLAELRGVIRASTPVTNYDPRNCASWDDAYGRFRASVAGT
ncbi:MAG TPA: rhamnulokinase family protein [Phycisphaerae bacterium]|nr:rhamnulokinase family protein [Phycisphaerae bacterium]